MPAPYDANDDLNHRRLFLISKQTALPGYVKEAAASTADHSTLPDEWCGDPIRRKFPLNTKAACWLSYAYFLGSRGAYNTKEAAFIQDRIKKAGEFWNIAGELKSLEKDLTAETKAAEYALTIDVGLKSQRTLFPLADAVSVKTSGENLFANRHQYPYEWRKTAARAILRKAAQLTDVAFSGEAQRWLEKAAGFGVTSPRLAAEKLANRVLMIPNKFGALRVKMAELTKTVQRMPKCTPTFLQKLAAVVDRVDRDTGLARWYRETVDLPEEMFFDVLQKDAASVLSDHVSLTTGHAWPMSEISKMSLEKIAGVLGHDFVKAVADDSGTKIDLDKFAALAPTLPRDDAALLETALNAALQKEAKVIRDQRKDLDADNFLAYLKGRGFNAVRGALPQ